MAMCGKTVIFTRPFRLSGMDEHQPAGIYTIETDADQIGAASHPARARPETWIRVPLPPGATAASQVIIIDPAELEMALAQDALPEQYGPETAEEYAARRGRES